MMYYGYEQVHSIFYVFSVETFVTSHVAAASNCIAYSNDINDRMLEAKRLNDPMIIIYYSEKTLHIHFFCV